MTLPVVMDLTVVCDSFPKLPSNLINREHILTTIDTIFDGDTELVMIEGEDGIGKTCVAAQFANKHPLNTFSIFLRPASRLAYDPDFITRDLCNQFNWSIFQEELAPEREVSNSLYRSLIASLQRRSRQKRLTYFFVLDGLHEIPSEDLEVQSQILDLMPFGIPGFKFLLTGEVRFLPKATSSRIHVKQLPITGFTLDETKNFFLDLEIEDWIGEIYQTCKGIPGYLASVRRIIESGENVEVFLSDMPNKLPSLFE